MFLDLRRFRIEAQRHLEGVADLDLAALQPYSEPSVIALVGVEHDVRHVRAVRQVVDDHLLDVEALGLVHRFAADLDLKARYGALLRSHGRRLQDRGNEELGAGIDVEGIVDAVGVRDATPLAGVLVLLGRQSVQRLPALEGVELGEVRGLRLLLRLRMALLLQLERLFG